MKIIVLTSPEFLPGECGILGDLLLHGADGIHLRKPGCSKEQMEQLIEGIPVELRQRLTLHEHFDLHSPYNVGGIHLNKRNPQPPADYHGRLSCSCHTLEEVAEQSMSMDYVFLSPIFDSISKHGYMAGFSHEELQEASRKGIIGRKTIALGGISKSRIPLVKGMGFGGIAVLGDVWQGYRNPADREKILRHFDLLRDATR